MTSALASAVFAILILGLFWLDRDKGSRVSKALWIPVIWWLLAFSRSVNQWLNFDVPVQGVTSDQLLEGSPIDRAVYSGLLALGGIVLVKRRSQVMKLLQENGPIIVFFFYCAVSIIWSDYPEVAFKRWNKAVGDFVMILVVLSDREPYAAFERLLARTTFFLVPLSVLVIKYYPTLGRGYGRWDYKTFYTGVSLNKNGLGMICLLCGLATVWRLLVAYQNRESAIRTKRLLAHLVILMMIMWLFWLANSMTSLSCFLLGSVFILFGSIPAITQRPLMIHLVIAAILSVTISILFLNVSPDVLESIGRDPTLTDRTNIWALLISITQNHLVGTGYESFWLGSRLEKIWSVYKWGPISAHNGYLEVFLNLGWVGVALVAVVIATGYRKVIAAFHDNPQIGNILVAYFMVGIVYNFTEAALFRMMAPVWMSLFLAISGAALLSRRDIYLPVDRKTSRVLKIGTLSREGVREGSHV